MIGLKVVDYVRENSEGFIKKILKGDYIVSVDGENMPTVDQLIGVMNSNKGSLVTLEILRDTRLIEKQVVAGSLGINLSPIEVDAAYEQAVTKRKNEGDSSYFSNIIVTTAHSVEGRPVTETLDVISAECVFGLHLFKDMFAAIRDVAGRRSAGFQNALKEAKETCLAEIRRQAWSLEADAVIAVDLDYSEICGGGKSMLFVVATGTAVKLT